MLDGRPKAVSRRSFIRGVICGGAAVSSASYLFRASAVHGSAGDASRLIQRQHQWAVPVPEGVKAKTAGPPLPVKFNWNKVGLRPRRMRRLYGADRRRAALLLLGAHPHGAGPERGDHRGARKPGRNSASRATGSDRRAGIPVCVLYVGLHHGHGRVSQDKRAAYSIGAGARHFGKPVPVPELHRISAMMRGAENRKRVKNA